MDFEAIRVDSYPVDSELTDPAHVGPELAGAAGAYLDTPRALVWRNPSPEWRVLVVLLPLASRLSLMTNPIFGQLVRDWGHTLRFIGIDRDHCAYDFRGLLTDSTLRRLVSAMARWLHDSRATGELSRRAAETETLDVLFAALGENMLTLLENRRDDWGGHLAREHRLEPSVAQSLFDRASRYPDFVAQLHDGLRRGLLDVTFYGRVLRAMDLRETAAEQRTAALIESTLEPVTLVKLQRTRAGQHLGCYNWLLASPRHATQRAYTLTRLPVLAQFFADNLIDAQPRRQHGLLAAAQAQGPHGPGSQYAHEALRHAIDSGQDRAVIAGLSGYFKVQPNVIRGLWRFCPPALGAPPSWHLRHILLRLNSLPERYWPHDDAGWRELAGRAVPALAQ